MAKKNCLALPIPQLPTISASLTLPLFSFSFSADLNFCCHLQLFDIPPINIGGFPIPGGAAVLAGINAEILTIDAALDAFDILAISCPFE